MKKLRILALAAVVLLSLTACGGDGGQSQLPQGTWGESNWSQVRWGP